MIPSPQTKPELTCLRCGYDLRGGAPAGKCPECGTSIGASYFHKALRRKLVRASLADANPAWRKSILIGMWCLAAMVLIDFITPMIAQSGVPSSAWPYVDASLAACCWVLLIVATFKLTQPQMQESLEQHKSLIYARLAMMIYAAAAVVPVALPRVPGLFQVVRVFGAVVATALLHAQLGQLAQLLPSRILYRMELLVTPFLTLAIFAFSNESRSKAIASPLCFGPIRTLGQGVMNFPDAFSRPGWLLIGCAYAGVAFFPIWFLLAARTRNRNA